MIYNAHAWLQSKCECHGEIRTRMDHSSRSMSKNVEMALFFFACFFLHSNKIRPQCLLQIFNIMSFHLLNLQIKWRLRLNCSVSWHGDCHHPVSAFLQRVIWMKQSASTRATDWGSRVVRQGMTAGRSDVCVWVSERVQQAKKAT